MRTTPPSSLFSAREQALADALSDALSEFERLAKCFDYEGMSHNHHVAGALRSARENLLDPEQVREIEKEAEVEALGQAMEP